MSKRLSDNPNTIRTKIEQSEALIASYNTELEHTPLEDEHGQAHLKREIRTEKGILGRLRRHLDGLEDEFSGMYETANAREFDPTYDE